MRSVCGAELRQAELISGLCHYGFQPAREGEDEGIYATVVDYSIILTPDCDLLQDFKNRRDGIKSRLDNVLLFEAAREQRAKDLSGFGGKEWGKVKNNEIERYHFMAPLAHTLDGKSEGIDTALVIDFRRYFTLSPFEIHRQVELENAAAYRRFYLSELWREHLQRRAMSYMQRVALPEIDD